MCLCVCLFACTCVYVCLCVCLSVCLWVCLWLVITGFVITTQTHYQSSKHMLMSISSWISICYVCVSRVGRKSVSGCDDLLGVVCHWWGHSCVYHTIIGVRELSVCYIIILWSRDAPKGPKTKRNGWTYYTLASLGGEDAMKYIPNTKVFFCKHLWHVLCHN